MNKPIIIHPQGQAFDVNDSILIQWQLLGEIQAKAQILIYDNDTEALAYDTGVLDPYLYLEKTLTPADYSTNLVNGKTYKVKVTVWSTALETATSDFAVFTTADIPVLTITPDEGTVLANQNYTFVGTYSQTQSIPLQSYRWYLYDGTGALLFSGDTKITEPIQQTFDNLPNNSNLKVRLEVTAENGMFVAKEVNVSTNYDDIKFVTQLISTNLPERAAVKLDWNIIQIIGITGGSVSYINNEKIDLTYGNVTFNEGVDIDDVFTIKIWMGGVKPFEGLKDAWLDTVAIDEATIKDDTTKYHGYEGMSQLIDYLWETTHKRISEEDLLTFENNDYIMILRYDEERFKLYKINKTTNLVSYVQTEVLSDIADVYVGIQQSKSGINIVANKI